jgi:hypothetical protein
VKADTKSKAKNYGQPDKELRVNSSNPTQTLDGITSKNYKIITANNCKEAFPLTKTKLQTSVV